MEQKYKNSEVRRLILAKKLYLHGCKHIFNKDEISRMFAIHHFDNAIEIILKCVATKHEVVASLKQEYKFKDLWNEISKRDVNLPLKDQMFALHDLRNLVQHQGDIPSLEAVVKYKGYMEDFFNKVCSEIFGVPYNELYLSELIESKKLREKALSAEKAFEKGEYKQCIELCDDTFIAATFEEGDIFGTAGMLTGYWGASEELKRVISKDYAEKYKGKDFYNLTKDLSKAISQIGQAATGMQFLDEYRVGFLRHRRTIATLENLSNDKLKERAELSLNFVIDIILKWQEEGIFRKEEEQ